MYNLKALDLQKKLKFILIKHPKQPFRRCTPMFFFCGQTLNFGLTSSSPKLNPNFLITYKIYILKIHFSLHMSYFSFYHHLLNPPHHESEILRNLHSLQFLPYTPYFENLSLHVPSPATIFPFLSRQFNKLTQTIHSNQLLIKNEEISGIRSTTNINILCQTRQLKKQQINERQDQFSHQERESSVEIPKILRQKTQKKLKTKKLSIKEKKERQMKRNSSENSKRNIIPNQIHQILSIILKKSRSIHLVEKLLSQITLTKSEVSLSVQRFYLYQSLLKEKINHYANEESLRYLLRHLEPECIIYSLEEQEVYCKVGLKLIRYFLRQQATLIILNSQRIKSSNKMDHLKTKRYLQNFINEMVRETFHEVNLPTYNPRLQE